MLIDPQLSFQAYQGTLLLIVGALIVWSVTREKSVTDRDALQDVEGLLWERRRHHSAYVPSDKRGIANSTLQYHPEAFSQSILFNRWGQGPHWWPNV